MLKIGEVFGIIFQCFEIITVTHHHKTGGIRYITPFVEIDSNGIRIFQLLEFSHIMAQTGQGGIVNRQRVSGKIIINKE